MSQANAQVSSCLPVLPALVERPSTASTPLGLAPSRIHRPWLPVRADFFSIEHLRDLVLQDKSSSLPCCLAPNSVCNLWPATAWDPDQTKFLGEFASEMDTRIFLHDTSKKGKQLDGLHLSVTEIGEDALPAWVKDVHQMWRLVCTCLCCLSWPY